MYEFESIILNHAVYKLSEHVSVLFQHSVMLDFKFQILSRVDGH